MRKETLLRALVAVRERLANADRNVADWLQERDRRRRQEAVFLRGFVRLEGSQRKAAIVTGVHYSTISRLLNREAHAKVRASQRARRAVATIQNVATPPPPDKPEEPMVKTNVVELRRQRPDWHRREPRRSEMHKWYDQYLGWTKSAQKTARMFIFNESWRLPDAAYYDDDKPGSSDRNSAVGTDERRAKGAD